MKWQIILGVGALVLAAGQTAAVAQAEKQTIQVKLTVPSSAYKIAIQEIYASDKELMVLSVVKGGGIGLTVISKVDDKVTVTAPKLPVKHYIVGKNWNWTQEKQYTYLKNRKKFDRSVETAKAKKIYQRKAKKGAQGKNPTAQYIVMYRKEIFIGGRTKNGRDLKQLAEKHAKQFNGKVGRLLRIINGYTIQLTPENAKKLAQLPEVRAIELDRPVGIQ